MTRHRRFVLLLPLLASCATASPGTTGTTGSGGSPVPKKTCMTEAELGQVTQMGSLTSEDLQAVARAIAAGCVAAGWVARFAKPDHVPLIRMNPMRNRTAQMINTRGLISMLEAELVRTGKVKLLADLEQAQARRVAADPPAAEKSPDVIAGGWITEMTDAVSERETVHVYTIAFELLNAETNEKVWIDNQSVKKIVEVLPPCGAKDKP